LNLVADGQEAGWVLKPVRTMWHKHCPCPESNPAVQSVAQLLYKPSSPDSYMSYVRKRKFPLIFGKSCLVIWELDETLTVILWDKCWANERVRPIGGWVGLRVALDAVEKRSVSFPYRESNLCLPISSLVAILTSSPSSYFSIHEGESVNTSQMDIKRKICESRTWKNIYFSIHLSHCFISASKPVA
jgi:hypothetical protein